MIDWSKAAAGFRKTHHRGLARVGWFALTATAYNLVRLPKLVGMVAERCLESFQTWQKLTNQCKSLLDERSQTTFARSHILELYKLLRQQ